MGLFVSEMSTYFTLDSYKVNSTKSKPNIISPMLPIVDPLPTLCNTSLVFEIRKFIGVSLIKNMTT